MLSAPPWANLHVEVSKAKFCFDYLKSENTQVHWEQGNFGVEVNG